MVDNGVRFAEFAMKDGQILKLYFREDYRGEHFTDGHEVLTAFIFPSSERMAGIAMALNPPKEIKWP